MRRFRSLCALTLCSTFLSPLALAQQAPARPPPPPPVTAPAVPPGTPPPVPATGHELQVNLPEVDVKDPMLEEPPPASQQLTDWRQALRMIRANSSLLKTARSQVDLARGQSRQALAPALPSLTGDGQLTHHLL